jgi:hypothetical protein
LKRDKNIVESVDIDEFSKLIFLLCCKQYFEANPNVHYIDRVRYISPMTYMGTVQSICANWVQRRMICDILDQILVICAIRKQILIVYAIKNNAICELSLDGLQVCYVAVFLFEGIW